jgi:biopolymer transport protein ExbB
MGVHAGRQKLRWAAFAAISLALVLGSAFLVLSPTPARAQDDKAENAIEKADEKAEPSAAVGAKQNLVKHIVVSAGPFFGPLLLMVSIGLVAMIVLFMDLRMIVAIPPAFVDEFTDTVNKRKFREAYEMARNDTSYLGRVLTAGMGRLQYGIEDARETAYHTVDSVRASKDQLITYLATIGALGPMIGLVGTVYGMILSFMELSQPGKTPNPQKLADGISHALVVTLLGVALAVPAIFFHAFFRNRLVRISMDAANVADDLITQMYHNSKKPAPAAAPSAAEGRTTTLVKPAEA